MKSFQQSMGLVEDGIVGPATWGAMPKDPNTPLLRNGDTGAVVKALQHGLHTVASGGSIPDPGPNDGIFKPIATTMGTLTGRPVGGDPREHPGCSLSWVDSKTNSSITRPSETVR